MPRGITPAPGIRMMPMPAPTNQIGRTVGPPLSEVVMAELAVRPAMLDVVVEKVPDSKDVLGPRMMGTDVGAAVVVVVAVLAVDALDALDSLDALDAVVAEAAVVLGPPSSVARSGLLG